MRARDCADRLEQIAQVATLDRAIGNIHETLGGFLQAIEAYSHALQSTTNPDQRSMLKAEIGAAYVNLADERSVVYLQQALDELNPATHAKETGTALLWLGRYYHLRAQYTQALIHLEQARTLIEPLDDAPTLGLFYGSMAIVLMYSGRFAESMSWARRGIALSEAKNDMQAIVLGYLYLSENSEYRGHWRDTQAFAARGHLFAR